MNAVLSSAPSISTCAIDKPVLSAAECAADVRRDFHAARGLGQRAKDAAQTIGVSEGEAMAAHAGLHDHDLKTTPLRGPWVELLQALELCGPVMALTRNASTVHEKTGVYRDVSATGHMGLALGPEIDLRLFFSRWHAGFAVQEAPKNPKDVGSLSLQFFDAHGLAVHKIFARPETDREVFHDIIKQYSAKDIGYEFTPAPVAKLPVADGDVDVAGLTQAWREMTDTHQFFGVLSRFSVERQQALRLVHGVYTERVALDSVHQLLNEAAFSGTSIMAFVGNRGCIQIHTGPVKRIEPMVTPTARWLNVLDKGFSLHLREDMMASAWVVRKPTSDGTLTSVEVFDTTGELMVMFFGTRKAGDPEPQAWRDIVTRLTRLAQPSTIPNAGAIS